MAKLISEKILGNTSEIGKVTDSYWCSFFTFYGVSIPLDSESKLKHGAVMHLDTMLLRTYEDALTQKIFFRVIENSINNLKH